jgi:hypothetical protein
MYNQQGTSHSYYGDTTINETLLNEILSEPITIDNMGILAPTLQESMQTTDQLPWDDTAMIETLNELFPDSDLQEPITELLKIQQPIPMKSHPKIAVKKPRKIRARRLRRYTRDILIHLKKIGAEAERKAIAQGRQSHAYKGMAKLSPWQSRKIPDRYKVEDVEAVKAQEYLHQYRTSPIVNSPNGTPIRKTFYYHRDTYPTLESIGRVQPIHLDKPEIMKTSPYMDRAPLSQYLTPIQPMILPPIILRPDHRVNQLPLWIKDHRGTHFNIHQNQPLPLHFIDKNGGNEDDYLIYHITQTYQSHHGHPVTCCQQLNHKNRRTPHAPFYIEAALRKDPWLRHFTDYQLNGHHYSRLTNLTGVRTIYLAFPCPTECKIGRPDNKITHWFFHCEGIYNGKPVQQTVPIKVKSRILMPPDPSQIQPQYKSRYDPDLLRQIYEKEPEVITKLSGILLITKNI